MPGGLAPFPRGAGCPLTLIFSASSNLWQNAFKPCDKPWRLAALHRVQMVSRNRILWASSWQPGDRETNGEREKVDTWPAGLEHWGCSAVQETWGQQLCPASSPPAALAAGLAALSGDAGTATTEMAVFTFSELFRKAWMNCMDSFCFLYRASQLDTAEEAPSKGEEQGGL